MKYIREKKVYTENHPFHMWRFHFFKRILFIIVTKFDILVFGDPFLP